MFTFKLWRDAAAALTRIAWILAPAIVSCGIGVAATPNRTDIILAGHDGHSCYWSPSCYDNPALVRADKDGNVVWQVSIPVAYWYAWNGGQIADRNITEDSFYLSTQFDETRINGKHRLLKFDQNGSVEWDRQIAATPMLVSANPVLGGAYAATGDTLYRVDPSGNTLWTKTFAFALGGWVATDVGTGGVYVTSGYWTADYGKVLKIDPAGNVVWTKTLLPHAPVTVLANPVDGGVYVASESYGTNTARLDRDGNVKWWVEGWPPNGTFGRAVNPADGSLYIGAWYQVGKVAMDGTELWLAPTSSYNPYMAHEIDGSNFYVSAASSGGVEKYNSSGVLVWSKWIGPASWRSGFLYDMPGLYTGTPVGNRPPVASCVNAAAVAGATCTANASINNGSYDPDLDPLTITQSPAGPYPLGATAVLLTVADNRGASATCTANVSVTDATPPVLTVGAPIVENAAGPAGAVISEAVLAASATDNCTTVTITRSPPGNQFPVGVTSVVYLAKDGTGNHSTATRTVTVLGAADQTTNLRVSLNGASIDSGVKTSLSAKLDSVLAAIQRGSGAACNQLGAFMNEVNAQAGKKIPEALAQEWIAAATRIQAALGC